MPLRESVQNQSERAHYLARTDLFVNIGMIDGIMRFAYLLFTPPVRPILTPDLTFFRERGICGTSRTSQILGVTSSEKRHSISLHKDIAQEDISVNDKFNFVEIF